MLTWLDSGAAWWLLLVPALVALYVLRQSPTRRRVPSLLLWRSVPQIEQARLRLRLPLLSLLLLQALLLLLGAFALMQPVLTAPVPSQLVILLDASGGMQTQEGQGTRFDEARAQAESLISQLGAAGDVTLVRVANQVTIACSACTHEQAQSILSNMQPGATSADMKDALNLADQLSQHWGAARVTTTLISDGAFADASGASLPDTLNFVRVGTAVNNRAITAISASQSPDDSPGYVVYARVQNFGAADAAVQINGMADTIPQPAKNLTIPAGGKADVIWNLPAGTARFTMSLHPGDALPEDDQAVLTLPGGAQNRIWINAPDSDLYIRALSALPGFVPVAGRGGSAAIAIASGAMPDPLPAGGVLLINPSTTLIPISGTLSYVRPLPATSDSPLMSGVNLTALLVTTAQNITPPAWLQTVVDSSQGPLILAGEDDGRRVVVLTFDPHNSNLPKLSAFPLLMANVAGWLYPLGQTQALSPGATLNLAPGTIVETPAGPGGRRTEITVGADGVFTATEQAGVYMAHDGALSLPIPVNMADASESDIAPRDHPELNRATAYAPSLLTEQEFWTPLAAVALLLMGSEWLLFCWKRGQA